MPLGIFGGSSKDSGPKLQPLTSTEEKPQSKKEKGISGISNNISSDSKDLKGTTVKLNKKTFTIERKLAEGGFAIVYLVNDKHSRNYALKRQLVRDDPRQVEACRTEIQIVKNLNGHKNIVAYVDHQLSVNKVGIYDYMLLTVYYPAVARLHHSKTPVIHRDLKVENVLIDQRSGSEKSVYILCDFGSSTTKVLSKEHFTHEIQRYTTLSYRAPEMIDLYSGIPIDTKSDMWALGILLYKLCYFLLPFGESALAIQSGLFTFPDSPPISDEIKAIINLLLTLNALHRPNIYQASHLAFFAADRKCPVYNIERSLRIELSEAVQILKMRNKLGSDYARLYEKAFNDFEAQRRRHTAPSVGRGASDSCEERQRRDEVGRASIGEGLIPKTTELPTFADRPDDSADGSSSTVSMSTEGVIVNTTSFQYAETHRRATTTSVNPRLRPKPQTTIANTTPMSQRKSSNRGGEIPFTSQQPIPAPANRTTLRVAAVETDSTMCDFLQKSDALQQRESLPPRLNSAFRPYTLTYDQRESNVSVDANKLNLALQTMDGNAFESSNPFIQMSASTTDRHMDDNTFGECFDKMRRSCVIDQQLYTDCKDADGQPFLFSFIRENVSQGCPSSYDKETWQRLFSTTTKQHGDLTLDLRSYKTREHHKITHSRSYATLGDY
uniref:non-specific serine/threonine protein kinase n=1 Tax=Globodera pallida TaxID=36090 RepID=A0A183CMF6_GLOPA